MPIPQTTLNTATPFATDIFDALTLATWIASSLHPESEVPELLPETPVLYEKICDYIEARRATRGRYRHENRKARDTGLYDQKDHP